ncbi:MAG: ABC transporter substrate-binding protein, partial [Oceanidesulfovibrio sp.]
LKRAALLYDSESEYSLNLTRSFGRKFVELGGTVVLEQPYRFSDSSYGPLVKMAIQAKPDLLFVAGHDESAIILRTAEDMGLDAVFMGGDGWDTPGFFTKGGNTLSQGYFTTHWDRELNGPLHTKFLEYCNMPESSSALAFDAVLLAVEALRRADPKDHASVRDALASIQDFRGVTGLMDMTAWGDAIKPVVLKRIVNGEQRLVRRYMP